MLDLGIVLYGFDCCRISELFEKANGVRKVSCMSVFLYLLIDYDLKKKIFRKFYLNESAELLDCK